VAKKSKTELEYLHKGKRIDRTADVLGLVVKYGSLALIAYFAASVLKSFAGETTFADIGVKFVGDLKVSDVVFAALAGGGVTYGYRQRKLRRDTIEAMAPQQRAREEQLDPRRSSSNLTARGTTRPEDRR
jgi:hypothetical protein